MLILKSLLPFGIITIMALVASAQDLSPYDVLPADADVIVRIKSPDSTVEDLANFFDKVQPGTGTLVRSQKGSLGRSIGNASLAGVDSDSDWFIIVFMKSVGRPDTAVLLPATDAGAAAEAAGNTGFLSTAKGNWVVVTRQKSALEKLESHLNGGQKGIMPQLNEDATAAFRTGHFSVLVNGPQLRTTYATQLEQLDQNLDNLVGMITSQVAATNPQMNVEPIAQMYRQAGRMAIRLVRDAGSLVINVTATESALEIGEVLMVTAESESALYLAQQSVDEFADLKKIPDDLDMYMGLSCDMQPMMQWSMQMMGTLKTENPDSAENLQESMELMSQAELGTILIGASLPAGEGIKYLARTQISPIDLMSKAMKKMAEVKAYDTFGIRQETTFREAAETLNGTDVDVMTVKQIVLQGGPAGKMQQDMINMMYGKDGLVQRFAAQDGVMLQTMGGTSDDMVRLLEPAGWKDDALINARSRHPRQTNILALFDGPSSVLGFMRTILATGAVPLRISSEQLDELELPRSIAGFSVTTKENQVSALTVLPVEMFRGFIQLGTFVRGTVN